MPEARSGGVSIHYEVEGDGPPIVLHTGAGGDLEMWRQAGYVGGLSGMQVVLMDHRGHGRSGRPKELAEHRIDRYVDDVVAVADVLGLTRFSFLGYSDGTAVGCALAARHPDRVDAVIGVGSASTRRTWSSPPPLRNSGQGWTRSTSATSRCSRTSAPPTPDPPAQGHPEERMNERDPALRQDLGGRERA